MVLISTHIAADFDAFASVLAARKLHPEARVFFPGSREESVRRLEDTGLVPFEELRHKDVDPGEIRRLILCDIRQKPRLGVVAEWLDDHPEIEVIAYDHHPDTEADVAVDAGIVDPQVGSTSTLLVEEIRRRELAVTPEEATLLLMGIYEDTGSLTFVTTSERDYTAAAWLLSQGGELAVVRRFAVDRLDVERLDLLHRMTRELAVFRLHDHRVGVVTLDLGGYVEELAPLVSRLVEIFELPLLFALFGEGDRVSCIARGELPGVDLGELLAEFAAGGGHATAASGRIKGKTLLEVRERLLDFLERRLPPAGVARDLMIEPFFRLQSGTPVEEAKGRLVARRVNAAPVMGPDGRPVGWVSRQILDAALQHGLAERPVDRVMTPTLEWIGPEASAEEVAERILDRRSRFVLVGDQRTGEVLGLITRMEVLSHLYGRLADSPRVDRRTRRHMPSFRETARLLQELPEAVRRRVQVAAQLSRERGVPVYLVGGLVRDLVLGRENRDVDLVVQGDGIAFAEALAEKLGGRCRSHEAFLTAVVVDAEDFHVDVATARSEFYRAPAALPEVETSTLRQDLYRRDFTVNTLALRLGPQETPELIDHFGGRQDLDLKILRVLHSLSFVDDPTRAFRAVRLELRLGFEMSPETEHLVQVALEEGVFDRLSGARLRDELALLLEDPDLAVRAFERLDELGLLTVLHPRLRFDDAVRERVIEARSAYAWFELEGLEEPPVEVWKLMLLALVGEGGTLGRGDLFELAERLMLAAPDLRLMGDFRQRLADARKVLARPDARPHEIHDALERLGGEETLLLLALSDEPVRTWVHRDLTELRRLELTIRGGDLVEAGFEPGAQIGDALRAVRAARLDGELAAEDELDYGLRWLRERAPGGPTRPPGSAFHAIGLLLSLAAWLVGSLIAPTAPLAGQPPTETPDPAAEGLLRPGPRTVPQKQTEEPLPEVAPPDPMRRPPIREVLRYDCESELARRSLVLFDDRTVRLKETTRVAEASDGGETLTLHQLDPDRYEAFLRRLAGERAAEPGDLTTHGPGGAWVEGCRLVLELPGREREEHRFGRYDALSLSLSRRVAIAEEMAELAEEVSRLSGLPRDYEGRRGDVLERRDGALFEIVRETGDRGGWELAGIDQPLTVYIPKGALRQEFVRLVSREELEER